ncbi:SDR family NAD(P)-dependent oxidoreductase [Nocardia iowensis]|uniref:SDR family oxidoreductase n=1 Tax=Nocardia iowensis TaxID=204891 RepID=A0ABX8RM32_NOCIO|nr:SDR family oxidoreductase [Nocardia iowensis]QXN90697.1 SDR family oxidoreductase [Nocardia iowensis]
MSASKTALVTGASSGIGAAFARLLAAEGYALVLVARREEKLAELATELREGNGVSCEVLAIDLTEPGAPEKIMAKMHELGRGIDVLVNNAGLCANHTFANASWESLAGEIQLMITAVTELTHRALPHMRERGWGRVINLSSVSAFGPPGQSLLYTGIKTYVLHMSQSLNMELAPQGIHVTALCPGQTRTEFHDVMGVREIADGMPGFFWQDPEDVAAAGWKAVSKGKPVCVPGGVNKIFTYMTRPMTVNMIYRFGRDFNPFKNTAA